MRQKQECKTLGTTRRVFPDGGGSATSKATGRPREVRDGGWIQLLVTSVTPYQGSGGGGGSPELGKRLGPDGAGH